MFILGAKNHRFFIGYLMSLLCMCAFVLYGSVLFWNDSCGISFADGFWLGRAWAWLVTIQISSMKHGHIKYCTHLLT